jgi:hypothetical protein
MARDIVDKVLVDLREDVVQIQLIESDVARDYVSLDKIDNDCEDEIFIFIKHAIHHTHGLSLLNPIKERVHFAEFH